MKKVFLTLALASTIFLSSCYGSFKLTKKYYDFNGSMGNKFLNELVFIASAIVPVYEVCVFVDAVVLNTIEFWSGSNPLADSKQVINTENGDYLVEANQDGYTITKGNETVQFINEDGVWYVQQGDTKAAMFSYTDENHICLNLGETSTIVELSEEGVENFRTAYAK